MNWTVEGMHELIVEGTDEPNDEGIPTVAGDDPRYKMRIQ